MLAKIDFTKLKETSTTVKRGDTIIEVMFAIAVFSLVAVITISMMNLGTANAEGSLELTTARHELNTQAEALRFIHSAYSAELALPECSEVAGDEKCQQYKNLWRSITDRAIDSDTDNEAQQKLIDIANTLNSSEDADKFKGAVGCARAYQTGVFEGSSLLSKNKAFVVNPRDLSVSASDIRTAGGAKASRALLAANNTNISLDTDSLDAKIKFTPTQLGARIIYSADADSLTHTTDDGLAVRNKYSNIARVEGIWVAAIAGEKNDPAGAPPFYDFYIQTCWNAPNSVAPTILDTVIRLYNPGAK